MLQVQFYLRTVILTMQYSEGTSVFSVTLHYYVPLFLFVQHSLFVNLIKSVWS